MLIDKSHVLKLTLTTTFLTGKLPALVKMLGAQKYFCGNDVSYADFALYTIMDLVRLVEPGVISEHNNITTWMSRVEQLPGVNLQPATQKMKIQQLILK